MRYLIQFWGLIVVILTPIQEVLFVTMFLIVLDTLIGLYAAYKNNIPITSRKLGNTISKFLLYNLAIISGYLIQQYVIGSDVIPIVKIIAGVITFTEFLSILENIQKVTELKIVKTITGILKRKAKENDML